MKKLVFLIIILLVSWLIYKLSKSTINEVIQPPVINKTGALPLSPEMTKMMKRKFKQIKNIKANELSKKRMLEELDNK